MKIRSDDECLVCFNIAGVAASGDLLRIAMSEKPILGHLVRRVMDNNNEVLIGTWKLVSCFMEDVETKEQKPVWG
jgi:hypothetical protein